MKDMAPEQFRGQAQPASDIFALGVILYQLCTGHLPFSREMSNLPQVLAGEELDPFPPSQLNPDLPPELDEPILRALAEDPDDRYRSAAAFWNALATVLSETRLPSETRRRAVNQSILSRPLSVLTAKVEAVEDIDPDPQATRAEDQPGVQDQGPKPIVLDPTSVAPTRRSPQNQPAQQPTWAERLRQPRQRKRLFIVTGIAAGMLVLLAILLLALPPFFSSALTITIIPRSHIEQNTYTLDANQVHAQQLTATAPTQKNTGNVSGSIPGTKAHGELEFLNNGSVDITIPTMTFVGKSGVPITFQGPVVVPAINPPTATVTAFAVNPGANGNIQQFDILQYCCAPNKEIQVRNPVTFTGGTDAQPNDQVQQNDIDQTAKSLTDSQTQQEQANLKAQMKSNEQVVSGSNNCQPTVTPDNPVGTQAKTVTVTVSVTCKEEVYNPSAAQAAATSLLSAQATQDLGTNYHLNGQITIQVLNAATNNSFSVQAQGLWVYTFTNARLTLLTSLVAGKTPGQAQTMLLQQEGVASVQIPTTSTLPSHDHIQMKVQPPPFTPTPP